MGISVELALTFKTQREAAQSKFSMKDFLIDFISSCGSFPSVQVSARVLTIKVVVGPILVWNIQIGWHGSDRGHQNIYPIYLIELKLSYGQLHVLLNVFIKFFSTIRDWLQGLCKQNKQGISPPHTHKMLMFYFNETISPYNVLMQFLNPSRY